MTSRKGFQKGKDKKIIYKFPQSSGIHRIRTGHQVLWQDTGHTDSTAAVPEGGQKE